MDLSSTSSAGKFVSILAEFQTMQARRMTWAGQTPASWVRDHGRDYPLKFVDLPARGPVRKCYANAWKLASRSEGRWRYVEGWATSIIPVEHAWCVDADGSIAEVTWPEDGQSYFGVELPLEVVREIHRITWGYGVFAQWWNWEKVLPVLVKSTESISE